MENVTFNTDDLGLASFLYASGVPFLHIDKGEHREPWKYDLCFDGMPLDLIEQWNRGDAPVNGFAMWQASRKLTRLFKTRR